MSPTIFEIHAEILSARWPALWLRLQKYDVESITAEWVEGRQGTLRVDGVQITSRHDRESEAQLQASTLKEADTLHLYGTGLGDLQRALLKRDSLRQLEVKIMNAALFLLVLQLFDHADWLRDPRVMLFMAGDVHEVQLPYFALPAELQLADDAASKMRDRLMTELLSTFVNRRFQPDNPILVAHLESNRALIAQDRDVGELFGSRPGAEALVIGAGPSLEQNLPLLRAMLAQPEKRLVICADTAAKTLLAHGIKPDYVLILDYRNTAEHLPVAAAKAMALVYFPVLSPATISAWQGVRYAAYTSSAQYDRLRGYLPRAQLFSAGSVIHPAIDLAVQMGCQSVTLLGADFAFPGNKTHTGWSNGALRTFIEDADRWVLDGWGQRVKSTHNFVAYLCDLERYISRHPSVTFWNTSKQGARIDGCAYHPNFVT